jgi:pimeloyl-ACP methyl ester carboxylesterase
VNRAPSFTRDAKVNDLFHTRELERIQRGQAPRLPQILIGGNTIEYVQEGEGKPLVFVHGACENSLFWTHQLTLSDRFKIISIDLPSHGKSKSLVSGPARVETYAEIVSDFLAKVCPDKAVLVGHSMGGAIALLNAIEHPQNLKGVVLVGTGAKLGVLPSIREGLRARFDETVKSIVGPRQFAAGTNLEVIRFVTNEIMKCKGEIASADYEACNGFDVRQKLQTISIPTLIMVGEEDRMTPVTWSTYMKENIPKSKLVILKEASHLPMLEKPDEFNRHLNEFVMSTAY